MRDLFRHRDFRRLFIGVTATMIGESALILVLAIWVKDLTGSSSLAGLTLFSLMAPALAAPLLGWGVSAASDAVITTVQALSIATGAALVAVLDYRLLFAAMAFVMAVSAAYLWAGRRLTPPVASAATEADPVAAQA